MPETQSDVDSCEFNIRFFLRHPKTYHRQRENSPHKINVHRKNNNKKKKRKNKNKQTNFLKKKKERD